MFFVSPEVQTLGSAPMFGCVATGALREGRWKDSNRNFPRYWQGRESRYPGPRKPRTASTLEMCRGNPDLQVESWQENWLLLESE